MADFFLGFGESVVGAPMTAITQCQREGALDLDACIKQKSPSYAAAVLRAEAANKAEAEALVDESAPTETETSHTGLYLALGIGSIVLLGGLTYLIFRRKRS